MEYTGPSDSYYDPPDEGPEYESGTCKTCEQDKDILVDTQNCDDCEEGLESAAQEAKYDEAKDEGRLRR